MRGRRSPARIPHGTLVRLETDYAVAGVIVCGGEVVYAAPIFRWMIGKRWGSIARWDKLRRWQRMARKG